MAIDSTELKNFFKERGITQEQIAERLGVKQPYVHALLTGNRAFGKKSAKKFEEAYGLSEAWLLTGKGEMIISPVVQNNQNGNNIHGATVNYHGENSTEKLITLLEKRDEQIDRLLSLLELKMKGGNNE